jgi:Replication-relaxation
MIDPNGTAATTRKHVPRYRRAETGATCVLTSRDLDILKLVESFRLASSEHVQLLIAGSDQNILRRLQALFHVGYVDRLRPRFVQGGGSAKMVYAITNKGAKTLQKAGLIQKLTKTDLNAQNKEVGDLYIAHTLLISRVRAVLTAACASHPEFKLLAWREGRGIQDKIEVVLPKGYAELPVAADSFFSIGDAKGRTHYFLEADRGTMVLERVARKLIAYAAYDKAEKHKDKFGIRKFRVLTVTASAARMQNLLRVAKEADEVCKAARTMFLFATEEQLALAQPTRIFEKIWTTPTEADVCAIP